MSTITKEFNKEQLIEHLRTRIEHRKGLIASMHIDRGYRDYLKLELRSSEIALASLEAEPVGEVVLGEYDDCGCHPDARVVCIAADGQADWENFKDGTRLYAAPPSLVVIDEREAFNAWNNDENLPIAGVGAKNAAWLAWQARAKLVTPPAPVSVPNSRAITQHFDTIALETAREIMCDVSRRHEFLGGEVQLLSRIQCRIDDACRAAMLQGADGNSPVIPDWLDQAEKMAELYGSSFVIFRNGESPQCADPSKVIISFTDEGLGHGAAAPQQEVK